MFMSAFADVCEDEPLPLIILVKGGDTSKWEELAQAALPMLVRPEKFSLEERNRMANHFRRALKGDFLIEDDNGSEWNGQDYEPGECLEWGDE
jgi:hypothetical protein